MPPHILYQKEGFGTGEFTVSCNNDGNYAVISGYCEPISGDWSELYGSTVAAWRFRPNEFTCYGAPGAEFNTYIVQLLNIFRI